VVPAVTTLALDRALPEELAAHDYTGAAQIVDGIVAGGGFARLRVFAGGRLIAQAGASNQPLEPLVRKIRDAAGAVVGTALFSVQNAAGYAVLAHALTRVPVLVREGRRRLAGTFAGPAKLPREGPLRYRGRRYTVASFTGEAFPSGRVEVYVLEPA
jgi:hypothetical protein